MYLFFFQNLIGILPVQATEVQGESQGSSAEATHVELYTISSEQLREKKELIKSQLRRKYKLIKNDLASVQQAELSAYESAQQMEQLNFNFVSQKRKVHLQKVHAVQVCRAPWEKKNQHECSRKASQNNTCAFIPMHTIRETNVFLAPIFYHQHTAGWTILSNTSQTTGFGNFYFV